MFFTVNLRGNADIFFELPVIKGGAVEATFLSNVGNCPFRLDQQFTAVSYSQFIDVSKNGFSGFLFEISTEGLRSHAGDIGECVELDGGAKMAGNIVMDVR